MPGGKLPRGLSMMNALMPTCLRFGSTSGEVRASKNIKSAPSAKVHQYLLPVMTHSSPSRRARHETLAKSEPAAGSDKARAPRYSPRATRGMIAARCASSNICEPIKVLPLAITDPTLIQARESSSAMRQYSKHPRPKPPYFSGMVMPKYPSSAILSISERGIFSRSGSSLLAKGSTSCIAKSLAASCSIRRSSVRYPV